MNPFVEIGSIFRLLYLMKTIAPDVILNFTPKINIYSSVAARMRGIPFVNNIAGLGSAFAKKGLLSWIVTLMYRISQRRAARIFFQNDDDMQIFLSRSIVDREKCFRIPGSGVDLDRFVPFRAASESLFTFLMVSRLVKEKGVREYVKAARIIRRDFSHVRCLLGGFFEEERSSGVTREEVDAWNYDRTIEFIGQSDNIIEFLKLAQCVVLPSYYKEGVPRILLEAAAMSIPVITTDNTGCRDVVDDGKNGYLCKPKDSNDLAEKMRLMLHLNNDERIAMGAYGRKKMEILFDEKIVIDAYLDAVNSIAGGKRS
jgi:glycosyltransferase involved in cell wall biosynthesis